MGLLKEFDVDAIKLDRRFFLGLSQPKAKDVVACLIALASRLGVSTVAEGIESEEQLAYLRQLRLRHGTGLSVFSAGSSRGA